MIGFTNALLLAGLIAIGLPVLIHMLTRPRPKVIKYPTFHMLVEAGSGQQALQRLRTILVLLLRSLLIAALVLVFTRPFWQRATQSMVDENPSVVLLVDASMSMGAAQGGVSLFDSARSQAADVLRSLDDNTQAAVILIGRKPRALLPVLSQNHAALHEHLIAAKRTFEMGDPASALDLAEQMLGETGGRIIILSDFQRTNWSDVALADRAGVECILTPVSDQDAENVGVTAMNVSPGVPIVDEKINLTVTLFNATLAKRSEVVHLAFEELTMDAEVELRPYSSADASFSFSMSTPGFYRGKVTLVGDGLPDDDARYITLHVRDALRALLISDAESTDSDYAAFYLARALSPSEYASTGIEVATRRPADLDRGSLETADLFVLAPPVRLTGESVDVIARRVRDGADLLCFMDGPQTSDVLNALAGASQGLISPPFTLARPVQSPRADLTFASQRLADPASMRLGLISDTDFSSLHFSRYFMTDNDPARQRELVMSHADGSAALAMWPCEQGGVVLMNFPVTPDAGNIAGNPLFPVLLHETLRALRQDTGRGEIRPGSAWTLDVPGGQSGSDGDEIAYRVIGPDEKPVDVDVISRGRTDKLSLASAELPGHYQVMRGDKPVDAGVVNVHPKETDTRQLNLQTLIESSAGGVKLAGQAGTRITTSDQQPLWPKLLILAVLCMTAEMLILAWWPTASRSVRLSNQRGVAS